MDKLFENYKLQKKLLVEALVEKDHLEIVEYPLLRKDFITKLGEPRYELYKLELDISRTRLKLEMMQICIQFQIPIDTEHIDRTLRKEFEKHFEMVKIMKNEIDSIRSLGGGNDNIHRNPQELKDLYYSVASYVHPELDGSGSKSQKRIWKAAKEAYEKGDAAKLRRLYKKAEGEFLNISEILLESQKELTKAVRSMKTKTKSVQTEIEMLKKQFPFSEAEFLESDEAVDNFKKSIDHDIKNARALLNELEKRILEILPARGGFLN